MERIQNYGSESEWANIRTDEPINKIGTSDIHHLRDVSAN